MHYVTTPADVESVLEAVTPRYRELAGKVAVVTGAAKGIGQGIAVRLAREGMLLVAADVDDESLSVTTDTLRDAGAAVVAVPGDLALEDDIDRLFETAADRFGTVDLLVNNAADLNRRRMLDPHGDLLDLQLATNIRSPYLCSGKVAAIMREASGGSIVNISSVGGIRAHQRGLPYDVTKGAIDAMTRAMAVDLGMYGIRVNAIGPGLTHTYRTDPQRDPAAYRAAADRVPLRRFGTPADIGAMVAFLASDDASYISGQVLYVDGGLAIQLDPPPGATPHPGPAEVPHA
jgi:3-oxoacyl-[acyl-carrier protein] reductase